jgi:hypothetical protein
MDVDALIAALEPYRGKKAFVFTDNNFGDHYLVERVAEITNGDNEGCPIIYFSEDNPFIFAEKRIKEITNKADAELRVLRDRVVVLQKELKITFDNQRLKQIRDKMQELLKQGEEIVRISKEQMDLEHQRAKRLT